jgi:catechol 2,3-dioxygenase-like lactoylglutathione lyase family enzyme
MWGKPPFIVPDNCVVDVRNLDAAREWYKEKLGLREAHTDRKTTLDDRSRTLAFPMAPFLSLVEIAQGASPEKRHVIFFAKNLEKTQQWLAGRGVSVGPTTTDSGGNRLFQFQDLEGNTIEVCIEP